MIQVANAPCSWGVIENIEGERGGYARVLDEMQEAGYAGTELGDWGFMPTNPAVLRAELDRRRLKLLASWVTVHLHDRSRLAQNAADALRTARQLAAVGGPDSLVVLGNDPYTNPARTGNAGRILPQHGMSEAQWKTFAEGTNHVARLVRKETGLRTVLHHHIGTWVETPEETDRVLRSTDREVLGLCLDTGHWRFAGGDPVEAVRRYGDRIWHVHFKDCQPQVAERSRQAGWGAVQSVENGVFCELGKGEVDFRAVVGALQARGYAAWIVVEQDVLPGMGSPKESAARNREYLRSIGL
jgi:inosose dehydratase